MKYAVIGFGNRGNLYTDLFQSENRAELVAVCERVPARLEQVKKQYKLHDDMLFQSEEEFFKRGKLADLLVVATQDADHYRHAIAALNAGYDLLLEKPIADTLERCIEIYRTAKRLNRKVFVCHVLRYAPFFQTIKRELDSGKYGKLITVNLTENVAYWHHAHSYVRGNWANAKKSTPMILAKCCHDLDILCWLFQDTVCKSVSSYGALSYFNAENAPAGSAEYCFECPEAEACPYNCFKIYSQRKNWLLRPLEMQQRKEFSEDGYKKILQNKDCPYARCVFRSDNDAVDHQVVNLLFGNGATAHLTMTAFSQGCYREIHVHCSNGDIYGSMQDNVLTCNVFGGESKKIDITISKDTSYGHGGGDLRMIENIIAAYEGKPSQELTDIAQSFASHCIGFTAERSRLQGGASLPVNIMD